MSRVQTLTPKTDPAGKLYRIAFDADAQIIRAHLEGFWKSFDVERFGMDLGTFMLASRNQLGSARILMDRRECTVQSADVAEAIGEVGRSLFSPDDRIAVVLESPLARMQLRRIVEHQGTQAFTDIGEAEAWLCTP